MVAILIFCSALIIILIGVFHYYLDKYEQTKIEKLEEWRKVESDKWFNELKRTHPELHSKLRKKEIEIIY